MFLALQLTHSSLINPVSCSSMYPAGEHTETSRRLMSSLCVETVKNLKINKLSLEVGYMYRECGIRQNRFGKGRSYKNNNIDCSMAQILKPVMS